MNKELKEKINKLPQSPGVYFFKNGNGLILYIGKAINIRKRVKSHFSKSADNFRQKLLDETSEIDFIGTENESQAIILESQMIKKYLPHFNIQWRDDKSFPFVAFLPEEWPRVVIARQHNLNKLKSKGCNFPLPPIGPFLDSAELKSVLRALRKILPYKTCKNKFERPCLQWHLGLCPAHQSQNESASRRSKLQIANSKTQEKDKYFDSLNILSQLLKLYAGDPIRIEAYDISNIQGNWATGSMVVFEGMKAKKSDYRKFRIKTVQGANDTAMIKEVLRRRFSHLEWPSPDLILIDGGKGQLRAAQLITKNHKLKTNLISLAKREEEIYTELGRRGLKIKELPISLRLALQAIRNEAHRFAITYYRKLHGRIVKLKIEKSK